MGSCLIGGFVSRTAVRTSLERLPYIYALTRLESSCHSYACIREVPDSNFRRVTSYSEVYLGFV
jgi:hypothetical protein